MIRKQTTLLWIVALVLSGFILIFERPWKKGVSGWVEQRSLLPPSQSSSWERLAIHNDQAHLEFVRNDVTWSLTQPIKDIGHPTLISGLLETLSNLKPKTVLSLADIQKAGGWKTFGLEPAATTMILSKGENTVRVQLGDRESVGNHVYLRLNEEPDAWVVDASWLDSLPDQLQAWRDPRIVSADIEDMDHIEISHVDARIVMDKNPNGKAWHFSLPDSLVDSRANITRIETLLTKSLPTLHVHEFLSKEEAGELKWLGLEDPVLELYLSMADRKPLHLSWGFNVPDKPGLRYAKLEGRPAIMLAPDLVFREQLNVPASAFRDPYLIDPAFSFNRLEFVTKEPFALSYDASQTKWKLEKPASLPTDALLVRKLFQTLANIQIKAYHDSVDPELEDFEITNDVFEKIIEHTLIQPTFVTHIPKELCPLAKITEDDESTIDVFELCINGQEIAPAYSEQNDPFVQREAFMKQVGEETQELDDDFLLALEHGMPPAGGMGLGIDRLVIFLTKASNIRDTILFPTLRPA